VADEGIEAIEREFELEELKNFDHLGVTLYKVTSDEAVEDVVDALQEVSGVRFAEPNFKRKIQGAIDPRFGEQWSLNNTGQTVNGIAGTAGVDINWPEAIDLYTSDEQVIVGVIDTGMGIDHPEFLTTEPALRVSFFRNFAEGGDINGVDDDQNGYIDDAIGWDFFDNDNLPLDENGHGSLVSSIIAGLDGNNEGGTGIAPNTLILPIRAFSDFGQGSVASFVEASDYAVSLGAKIINASYGNPNFSFTELLQIVQLWDQGVLLVAAAGNGGADKLGDNNDESPIYPASYNLFAGNVISVAAIDQSGSLTRFSNFGIGNVDIAAPGTNILGADISRTVQFREDFEDIAPGWTTELDPGEFNQSDLFWGIYGDIFGNNWLTDSIDTDLFGGPLVIDYKPNTRTSATSPAIDLSGYEGPQLSFDIFHYLNIFLDIAFVEVSTDKVNWVPIDLYFGNAGLLFPLLPKRVSLDLSSFENEQVYVRFTLSTDFAFQSDGVYIDNFEVSSVDVFQYDGTQYQFSDGTSFAAPMVSGVAALIWSQRPELTVGQVRRILLDSAMPLASLDGKVASGGSLDARRAMELAIAAPNLNSDLSIFELAIDPVFIDPGSSFDAVSYRVGNGGPGIMNQENQGVVVDIYISRDAVFGNGDDIYIGGSNWTTTAISVGGNTQLAPFSTLPNIVSPNDASGEYYVFAEVSHLSDLIDKNSLNDQTVSSTKITIGRTFSGWRNEHFDFEGPNQNPFEDWDNDGRSNVVEFAFAEDPKTGATRGNLPVVSLENGSLRLTFTRPSGVVGTSYAFERSSDLETWDPMQLGVDYQVLSINPGDDNSETVTIELIGSLSEMEFLRMIVGLE